MRPINLTNNRLMGKTVGILADMLDFRARNHGVIASNLSNIDTPGFEPKELEFDAELRRAVDGRAALSMTRTNEKHLSGQEGAKLKPSFSAHRVQSADGTPYDLDLDREMAKMAQNNLLYEATVKILSKKFDALKTAIEGRR
jgi:flagellar basal-body rod protein FlgB